MGCNFSIEDRSLQIETGPNPFGKGMSISLGGKGMTVNLGGKNGKAVPISTLNEKYHHFFRHQQIIQDCEARGQKYTDTEFPADFSVLKKYDESPDGFKKYTFKRASDFIDQDKMVVFEGIDPSDIRQGALGDCYLLCCLSVLAERQTEGGKGCKLIERLFITEEPNKAGCYAIWLNDAGTWKSIVVDDYLPYNQSTRTPAFSKSVGGHELWVMLLEKAYSKLFGGYGVIEGGFPQYALKDLTGAPYDSKESENPDEMWDYIFENINKQYLLTCYSKSTDIREEQNPLGVVFGHAYSVLNAKEVDVYGRKDRIVQIRNPWGKFEWKGDWSDDSNRWTEELKQQLNPDAGDDGIFWMSINDFVNYYQGVGICKLHEDYFYQSLKLKHEGSTHPNFKDISNDAYTPYENPNRTVARLHVDQKTHMFLSVNQSDDRKFLASGLPYSYSNVRILVAKQTSEGLVYVGGNNKCDRDVDVELTLNPGVYLVSIEIVWTQDHHKHFTLSAYSQNTVHLERLGKADFGLLERNIIKSFAPKNPNSRAKTYEGEPDMKRYMGADLDLVYFVYSNKSQKTFKETVTMTNRKNLRIVHPFTKNDEFEVTVPPNSDSVVIFKTVTNEEGYSFGLKSTSMFPNMFSGFMSEVVKHPSNETVYRDDSNDVVVEDHDVDCYNKFIKDDNDSFEPMQEKKTFAPAVEDEDEASPILKFFSKVRGELFEEQHVHVQGEENCNHH